jgi:WD40 repeat protein
VGDADWSPDGRHIVACGEDGKLHVFDVENGVQVHCLAGHTDYVFGVQWPQPHLLASCSCDKTVRLWRSPVPM